MYTEPIELDRVIMVASPMPKGVRRSLKMNDALRRINRIERRLNRSGSLTPGGVAKQFGNIVGRRDIGRRVDIENGWNSRRFYFVLEVVTPTTNAVGRSMDKVSYIQGYTDYITLDRDGNIDPDTIFYFNSVINVNYTYKNDELVSTRVMSAFKVIYNHRDQAEFIRDAAMEECLMRAEDISLGFHSIAVSGDIDRVSLETAKIKSSSGETSNNFNSVGSEQFATIVNKSLNSGVIGNTSHNSDITDTLNMVDNVAEYEMEDIPFFAALEEEYLTPNVTNCTYGDLLDLFPNIEDLLDEEIDVSKRYHVQEIDDSDVELAELDTNDPLVVKCQEFADALVAIMLDKGLTYMNIFASNDTDGECIIEVLNDSESYIEGLNLEELEDKVLNYVEEVAFPAFTDNDEMIVSITAEIDLTGTSSIYVEESGGDKILVPVPTQAYGQIAAEIATEGEQKSLIKAYNGIINRLKGRY